MAAFGTILGGLCMSLAAAADCRCFSRRALSTVKLPRDHIVLSGHPFGIRVQPPISSRSISSASHSSSALWRAISAAESCSVTSAKRFGSRPKRAGQPTPSAVSPPFP